MPFVCIHIRIGTMTKDLLPRDKSLKNEKNNRKSWKNRFFFQKMQKICQKTTKSNILNTKFGKIPILK